MALTRNINRSFASGPFFATGAKSSGSVSSGAGVIYEGAALVRKALPKLPKANVVSIARASCSRTSPESESTVAMRRSSSVCPIKKATRSIASLLSKQR